MITEEQKKQFFATQKKSIQTVNMNGKMVKLSNFPVEKRKEILDKLAEQDPVLALGQKGILPGIKIDGKQVTKDNIKDFEIKQKTVEVVKEIPKVTPKEEIKKEVKKVEKKISSKNKK